MPRATVRDPICRRRFFVHVIELCVRWYISRRDRIANAMMTDTTPANAGARRWAADELADV